MTSQLNVDTIVDKAGSGGTNVKIGNTSTYVSDGGAATQNTVQGIAKLWSVNFTLASSSGADEDGINVASTTDHNTGEATVNFSNNFVNRGFASHTTAGNNSDVFNSTKHSSTTGYERTFLYRQSTTSAVDNCFSMTLHGDLA